jgi:hypothetical protein
MTDWLVPLLQFGGTGVVIAVALYIMGKWLLTKITAALNAYVTAYAQQTANIDARIANLEKLAEEQARLTRTVESIKDEFSALAKRRDNQWEFRKDVYVRLITAVVDLIGIYATVLTSRRILRASMSHEHRKQLTDALESAYLSLTLKANEYNLAAALIHIGTADSILVPSIEAKIFRDTPVESPQYDDSLQSQISELSQYLSKIAAAGRKDLWGTAEPEVKPDTAT